MDLDGFRSNFVFPIPQQINKKDKKNNSNQGPVKKRKTGAKSFQICKDNVQLQEITESSARSLLPKRTGVKPKEILPGLYLGSALVANDYETLKEHNIKFVLNVTKRLRHYHEDKGLIYMRIPVEDRRDEPIQKHFQDGVHFIEECMRSGEGNVLIHCKEGKSRSPTILLAFLMSTSKELLAASPSPAHPPQADNVEIESLLEEQESSIPSLPVNLSTALEMLGGKENLRVNEGFLQQLVLFEEAKFGSSSVPYFNKNTRAAKMNSPLGKMTVQRVKKVVADGTTRPGTPIVSRKRPASDLL